MTRSIYMTRSTGKSRCKNGTRKNRKTGICEQSRLTDADIKHLLHDGFVAPEQRDKVAKELRKLRYRARYMGDFYKKTGDRTRDFYNQALDRLYQLRKGYIKVTEIS